MKGAFLFKTLTKYGKNSGQKNTVSFVGAFRLYGTSIGCQNTAPTERSIQNEIINALCSGERKRASSLLSELASENHDLESGGFDRILRYCASKPDPLFVMETWKLMKEKEIPSSGVSRYIIQALCKGGYVEQAFIMASTLEETSPGALTLPLFSILLKACIEMNKHVDDCLDLLKRQALGEHEIIYGLRLKLAVSRQDLPAVREIWEECINVYPMSIIMLRKFIWAFAELKDLRRAKETMQKMVAVCSQGNVHFVRSTGGKLHLPRLDVPMPLVTSNIRKNSSMPTYSLDDYYTEENSSTSCFNIGLEANEVRASGLILPPKRFTEDMNKLLRWSFNNVIHTCASKRNVSLAERLFFQMQNLGLEPSSSTYDGYVRALFYVKGFQSGVKVLEVMQQENLKPHESTLAVASARCSKALELNLAEKYLDQIPQCSRAYPYIALVEACEVALLYMYEDQSERAKRILTKMKHSNVTAHIRTYERLLQLCSNINACYEDGNRLSQEAAAKRIKAIQMGMIKHGIQHSRRSMQNMMIALGREGMTNELITCLQEAEKLCLQDSRKLCQDAEKIRLHGAEKLSLQDAEKLFFGKLMIAFYRIVLHSLVKAKEVDKAIEIFKKMTSCGVMPDETIYCIMIDCCSIIKCYSSACAVVSIMIRSGYSLNIVAYTALSKVVLRFNDFDEALKLLEQARSEGIQPDVVYYNTILKLASRLGRIDLIELLVEQMHRDKIKPDTTTCSHVFLAYVNNGFEATGMEALQVLSMRMISEDDHILQEIKMEYEDLIFSEDARAESQIESFERESPTLAAAMLNLRRCLMLGFPVSWSPNESPWAKRLSRTHDARFSRVSKFSVCAHCASRLPVYLETHS